MNKAEMEYECRQFCRCCPFPGAKCDKNQLAENDRKWGGSATETEKVFFPWDPRETVSGGARVRT